jgi:hypothetical protein
MSPTDRADLLARLEAGRDALLASVTGMSDAEAAEQPAPDRWSAIGNVEHLAMVEANLLRRLKEAVPANGEAVTGREFRLYDTMPLRARKFSAPAAVHPTGECQTIADALAKFDSARSQTVAFVQSCDYDPRLCSTTHPLLGEITGMECLFMIAAHPLRHAAQIRELRGLAAGA